MGTAVTEQQIGLVKRLSRNIVLALDADAAGQLATLRSLESMQTALDHEEVPVPDALAHNRRVGDLLGIITGHGEPHPT